MIGQTSNDNSKNHKPAVNYSQLNRRSTIRRTQSSEGYYYLHTIGWICRRTKKRRNNDISGQ